MLYKLDDLIQEMIDRLSADCPGCNLQGQPGIHVRQIKDQQGRHGTEAIPCPYCDWRNRAQAFLAPPDPEPIPAPIPPADPATVTAPEIRPFVHRPGYQRNLIAGNCRHSVHEGGRGVSFYQCQRKPKQQIAGYGFCTQHAAKVLASIGNDRHYHYGESE